MRLRNLFLTVMMLLSHIPFSYALVSSDTVKKPLTLFPIFKQVLFNQSLFGMSSLSYTFSGVATDTINFIRLCQATDNTCSSCNTAFASIIAGTPIFFASTGTTYSIGPASIAAYLSQINSSAGIYNIGFYVQSTGFNCSSSSAYCSTQTDSSSHALCMQAVYDGAHVTGLTQLDNGLAVLNVASFPFSYVTNSSPDNVVLKCPINSDGTFGACVDSGVGAVFSDPRGIAIHPNRNFAYISNNASNTVSKCSINGSGAFVACVDSGNSGTAFNAPRGIAIHPQGSFAYVVNLDSVSKCPINSNGAFGACADSGNSGVAFIAPQGITMNSNGTVAYVVNGSGSSVLMCPINGDGTFGACIDSGNTGAAFNAARYIVLNNAGVIAYVTNRGNNTVSKCPINGDGTFGACVYSGNSGIALSRPQGIAINFAGTFAYVANAGSTSVLRCPINGDSTFGACADSGNSGAAFPGPVGIVFTSIS